MNTPETPKPKLSADVVKRIKELLLIASKGPWERMDYGKQTLPYNVATTDGHYNNMQCLIARGSPTGGNGWPGSQVSTAEKIANAELICLLRNNIEAILELLATAYAEGQQSTMKIVSEESKKMCARIEQGKEPLTYQDRVLLEKKELDDKISRLEAFVGLDKFKELDAQQQSWMEEQLGTMIHYSSILSARIAGFNTPPPEVAPAPVTPASPVSEVRLSTMGQG